MTQPAPTPQAGTGAPTPPAVTPPAEPVTPPAAPKAPWEDGELDKDKATKLFQNMKADLDRRAAQVAELTPYKDKLTALEDAQKTEAQRLQDQAAASAKAAADAQAALARKDLQITHGISNEDADLFLTAGDPEVMKRQAEAIAGRNAQIAAAAGQVVNPAGGQVPVTALRPASVPVPPPASRAEQIAAFEREGKYNEARTLKMQDLLGQMGQQT